MKLTGPGGGAVFIGPHLLLPPDKARHVGEAVAMVVAETKAQAMDAAEAVEVRYEELPFVLHSEDCDAAGRARALGRGARQYSGRYAVRRCRSDRRSLRARRACRRPAISISAASPACRWSRAPRSASYDAATGRYTLYAGSGGAVRQKQRTGHACSASRPTGCACCRTMSAAISAPATASLSNSAWCCGRRKNSAGR